MEKKQRLVWEDKEEYCSDMSCRYENHSPVQRKIDTTKIIPTLVGMIQQAIEARDLERRPVWNHDPVCCIWRFTFFLKMYNIEEYIDSDYNADKVLFQNVHGDQRDFVHANFQLK